MRGGQFLNDYRMVEIFVKEAPARVYELEQWGGVFDRTPDGRILQRPFGAHTYRRLCHVGDRTGLEMIRTLQDRVVALRIAVYMEVTLTRLLKDVARVAGATGYTRQTGDFVTFRSKAVVLASGGWGRIYKVTSNSWEGTGDGVAMGFEAGAEVLDPEMVQFHPTGMVWPPGVKGLLVTEAVRGEGGYLFNSEHKRFMLDYEPEKKELASRDKVARAIYKEVQAGRGSPHGGAVLDVIHLGSDRIKKKLPSMYDQFLSLADVDITREAMEVYPTIPYAMGGLRVEPDTGAPTVRGLYAAGEVAAGLHGANRLGGNSLSDLLVFGRRAGSAAAEYARTISAAPRISEAEIEAESRTMLAPFERTGGESPYDVHRDLQQCMDKHVGISGGGEALELGHKPLSEVRGRARGVGVGATRLYNPGWHLARDLVHMITVSEGITRSALLRKESRGAHSRLDY